jgi:glycosyltransferase involved in cell wall biosynthesis
MSEKTHRRVLVLAYFFPPLGGGGVQRTLKFVKYLPEHGFAPVVLTTGFGWSPIRDPTLGSEIPAGTTIIRAPEVPLQVIKWGLQRMLRRARLSMSPASYLGWPDEAAGWVPGATWHALRAVRRHRPHVLYSTSSPVSAHLVALIVSRITGVPWVADFRDAWTRNPQGEQLHGPFARLSAALEEKVVNRANYVVVVDDSVELLGIEDGDRRRVVIPNGVDPEDVQVVVPQARGRRFRLSYVGALYGERNAAPVFAALRSLIGRGAIDPDELDVRLVGHQALDGKVDVGTTTVTPVGYVDHAAAVAEMTSADVLLFYAPASNRGSSGKIYEYLASGRPILCVAGSDNLAYQLVQDLNAGPCAEPGNQPGIEEAIEHLYRDWQRDVLSVDPQVRAETLRRFARPVLAGELAAVLDAAARDDKHDG